MEPARSVARLGFKRWYERQLGEAHAWLVSCLLLALVVAVLLEGVRFRGPLAEVLPTVGLLFVGGVICVYGLHRFFVLLALANHFAQHSTCRACGVYALFNVIEEYPERMKVRCRKCSHEWMLG